MPVLLQICSPYAKSTTETRQYARLLGDVCWAILGYTENDIFVLLGSALLLAAIVVSLVISFRHHV